MNDREAIRFAGLMEDYLNIPSFVCEYIEQLLKDNKYKEVVEYIIQRRNEIESKPDFISDRNAITMLVNQNENKDKEIERLNNIVNELEKSLINEIKRLENVEQTPVIVLLTGKVYDIYDELKKLKEGK